MILSRISAVAFVLFATGSELDAQTTTRSSVSSSGVQGNMQSKEPSISGDGRLVAFMSFATNLVAADTNGWSDIFVHDRQTGTTTRVSVGPGGVEANGQSQWATISSDGRWVVFHSAASNLVATDTNNTVDVFVHDLATGITELVDLDSSGAQALAGASQPSISADGRYVAFVSNNLVPGDANGNLADIFVRDRLAGTTTIVNVSSSGTQAISFSSSEPVISGDGQRVAFLTQAANLVLGDTNNLVDLFVRDLAAGTTVRVNVSSSGVQADADAFNPSISADGRFVAFDSTASNHVTNDTNGQFDVFVRDLSSASTTRVSVSTAGAQTNVFGSSYPSISADGRWVAFESESTNLVAGDTNSSIDVFLHDRQTGATTRESLTQSGAQSGGGLRAAVSDDGRFIAFWSGASNLVAGDTNNTGDVFLRDREQSIVTFCAGDGSSVACPCGNNGALGHGCDNSSNGVLGAELTGSGIASLVSDSLALSLAGEVTGSLRIFLQGDVAIVPTAFGDGLRCVGGHLKRLFTVNQLALPVTVPGPGDPPISVRSAVLGDAIPMGATRYYQAYYRDSAPSFCPGPTGDTYNISNGLSVTWIH